MLRCAAKMPAILAESALPLRSLRPAPSLAAQSLNLGRRSADWSRSLPGARCPSLAFVSSFCAGAGFAGKAGLSPGFRTKGPVFLPLRAVSGGGSGGSAGGGGGRGNGGSPGGSGHGDGGANGRFFLSWYLTALDKYPVITKAITSALLNLIGDLICQLLIDQVTKLDLKRTFVFTFLGLVLVGPTLHYWYLFLSKLVTLPGASGAFLRLLLDQFLFSPIFIGVFFSSVVALEGRPSQIKPKLQQEWFSAVLANWQLWIPFQFFNFRFVPQKLQVLAANFIALAWNVILSFKAHKEIELK